MLELKQKFRYFVRRKSQVYLRPTGAGWWWLGTLVLLILIGWGYSNNLCLAIAMVLIAMTMMLLLEAHFNLEGICIQNLMVGDQFLGEASPWKLKITERKGRRRHKLILGWDGDGKSKGPWAQFTLEGESHTTVNGFWRFPFRGVWQSDYVLLKSQYPLGLFEAWSYHQVRHKCWVYPQRLVGLAKVESQATGDGSETAIENVTGDEPGDFRRYHLGDPPTRVAWKVLARGLPLHSKTFVSDVSQEANFIWPWGQGTELERSQLAFQIHRCFTLGVRWSFRLNGQREFPLSHSSEHHQQTLRALTEAP